jgi:hypothetical protein
MIKGTAPSSPGGKHGATVRSSWPRSTPPCRHGRRAEPVALVHRRVVHRTRTVALTRKRQFEYSPKQQEQVIEWQRLGLNPLPSALGCRLCVRHSFSRCACTVGPPAHSGRARPSLLQRTASPTATETASLLPPGRLLSIRRAATDLPVFAALLVALAAGQHGA